MLQRQSTPVPSASLQSSHAHASESSPSYGVTSARECCCNAIRIAWCGSRWTARHWTLIHPKTFSPSTQGNKTTPEGACSNLTEVSSRQHLVSIRLKRLIVAFGASKFGLQSVLASAQGTHAKTVEAGRRKKP